MLRLLAATGQRRALHSSVQREHQHVMYLGSLLGYVSAERLSKFPRSWLDSVGMSVDIDQGVSWTAAHAGCFHTLMAYTLMEYAKRPARYTTESVTLPGQQVPEPATATVDLEEEHASSGGQRGPLPSKVFGLGRNTYAQLGLGFASQEATRGMMTGSIEGSRGITHLIAGGNGFSLVVTRSDTHSTVYGIGNDTLGALGLGDNSAAAATGSKKDLWDVVSNTSEPQLTLHPLPKPVPLPPDSTVLSVAAGMDHSLLLLETSTGEQHLLSAGLNTDGQLGVATDLQQLPIQPLLSKTFTKVPLDAQLTQVVCGADSSYALTAQSDIWAWGNSEYGQCLCGVHDRVLEPTFVRNPLIDAYRRHDLPTEEEDPQIKKLVAGGSFVAILDSQARVWVAGFGPTAQPHAPQTCDTLQLIPNLENVQDLHCGVEYIVAVTRTENVQKPAIWVWGIAPPSVSTMPILTPTQIPYTLPQESKTEVRVQHMACNKDHLIIVFADDEGAGTTTSVWAECIASEE